jgi:dCTP deaminase
MAVKSDLWIQRMAEEQRMIEPFLAHQVRDGVISYGLSSYGYDMRLGSKFKRPVSAAKKNPSLVLDPKNPPSENSQDKFAEFECNELILPPGEFVLGTSVEYFRIPRSIITIAYGKSTYARSGVVCNITPFEPEWEGFVTLMIANCGPLPVKIYANEGIAQVIFLESDEPCAVSYADRKGKYQKQTEITHSRL